VVTIESPIRSLNVKVCAKACAQVSGAVNKETQKGKPTHVDIDFEKEYVMVGGKVQTNRVRWESQV